MYQGGVRTTSRYFAAFCLRTDGGEQPARFGFTTPRALGNAPERNRIKRRMREAVRTQLDAISSNWVIVFNPKRTVLDAPFEDLRREVARTFARCRESSLPL
ncbi:MAG: ribonuclease P protein component [Bryobacteraceae bacterium]